MADALSAAWLEFFAVLPDGWTVSRPVPVGGESGWTIQAVRKPRRPGDPTVRVEARASDASSAVRALAAELGRLGYARAPRVGPGGGLRRTGTRRSSSH
jgi:hypothetical protein